MAVNDFIVTDFQADALDRSTDYFKEKSVYQAIQRSIISKLVELQSTFKDLMQLRSLDTATGEQLDVIGKIVGQPRALVDFFALPYFGFDGASGAQPFGDLTDNSVGGYFRSIEQPEGQDYLVDDETYRFLIKARIMANQSRCTPQDIIDSLDFITGKTTNNIEELGNANLRITVANGLSPLQQYLLTDVSRKGSILPIPIGVGVEYNFLTETYNARYLKISALEGYHNSGSNTVLIHHVKIFDELNTNLYINPSADSELDTGSRLYAASGLLTNQSLTTSELPWCSTNASSTHWLKFDLGSIKPVLKIEIKAGNDGTNPWGQFAPKNFNIEISDDDITYHTIKTITNEPSTRTDILDGWLEGESRVYTLG